MVQSSKETLVPAAQQAEACNSNTKVEAQENQGQVAPKVQEEHKLSNPQEREMAVASIQDWEAPMDWLYAGHGEWMEPEHMSSKAQHGNKLDTE